MFTAWDWLAVIGSIVVSYFAIYLLSKFYSWISKPNSAGLIGQNEDESMSVDPGPYSQALIDCFQSVSSFEKVFPDSRATELATGATWTRTIPAALVKGASVDVVLSTIELPAYFAEGARDFGSGAKIGPDFECYPREIYIGQEIAAKFTIQRPRDDFSAPTLMDIQGDFLRAGAMQKILHQAARNVRFANRQKWQDSRDRSLKRSEAGASLKKAHMIKKLD